MKKRNGSVVEVSGKLTMENEATSTTVQQTLQKSSWWARAGVWVGKVFQEENQLTREGDERRQGDERVRG